MNKKKALTITGIAATAVAATAMCAPKVIKKSEDILKESANKKAAKKIKENARQLELKDYKNTERGKQQ